MNIFNMTPSVSNQIIVDEDSFNLIQIIFPHTFGSATLVSSLFIFDINSCFY